MRGNTEKNILRREISERIAGMSFTDRANDDRAIPELFRNWLSRHTRKGGIMAWSGITVLAYMPLPDEPEITPLVVECVAGGGRLILPRVDFDDNMALCEIRDFDADLTPGSYGIVEPHSSLPSIPEETKIDIALVPGRAFTKNGDRLGRGKGCYDRVLSKQKVLKIALAYDCQIVDEIPTESHDEPVDLIITPTQTIDLRKS